VLGCDEVLPELVEGTARLLGIVRDEEVSEPMLRAAALAGLADESRLAVLVEGEEGVAFGGEAEAADLDLLAGLRVKVLGLELEDRSIAELARIGVEAPEWLDQRLAYLLVAEG
jgi:hypothetical protein